MAGNRFRLTFGEPTRADELARNLPDLIPVRAPNGAAGFWRSAEIYVYSSGDDVENRALYVVVYGPDGKTLVDPG